MAFFKDGVKRDIKIDNIATTTRSSTNENLRDIRPCCGELVMNLLILV
jgi:hypothetical protein